MAKVLDGERPRTTYNTSQTVKRRGRPIKLSLERLSELIAEEGPITDSAIALKLHVSRQTVMRARKRAEAAGRHLESITQKRSASRRKATNVAPFLALLGQMEWLIETIDLDWPDAVRIDALRRLARLERALRRAPEVRGRLIALAQNAISTECAGLARAAGALGRADGARRGEGGDDTGGGDGLTRPSIMATTPWQPLSILLRRYALAPNGVARAGEPAGPHRLSMTLGKLRDSDGLQVRVRQDDPMGRWRTFPPGQWYAYEVLPNDQLRYAPTGKVYSFAQVRWGAAAKAPKLPPMEQRIDLITPYVKPDLTAEVIFKTALVDNPGHKLLICSRRTRQDAVKFALGRLTAPCGRSDA